jgi:uncharacterized membrane protein
VYAIVRARSDVATARLAALVVWLYPPLAGLVFGDFHENGFAPAAVAWTLYAFDAGYLAAAFVFALVTLAVKEDQAVFLACAGAVGAIAYRDDSRRCRLAIAVGVIALLVGSAFFFVIQPRADVVPGWQPTRFYAWAPGDWRALVPAGILQRLGFLALILAPLAFVPLRTRAFFLAAAPLLEVLASRMSTTFTLGSHYAGAWIGYLLVAFAAGVNDLAARERARRALLWAVGLCIVELAVANPLHPGPNLRARDARDAALDVVLRSVPHDAVVATQEEAYGHLALDHPYVRLLPESPAVETEACYVLVDRDFPQSPRLMEYRPKLDELVAGKRYVRVEREDGVELYRRNGACR